MRRLDVPRGLTIEEEDNVIEVHADPNLQGPLTITVPVETSGGPAHAQRQLSRVQGLHGEVDADTLAGRIELTGISGTVVAHSRSMARIHVTMDRVDPSKPLSFSSLNGSIDVTLAGRCQGQPEVQDHALGHLQRFRDGARRVCANG
jgi:hypothetical protein